MRTPRACCLLLIVAVTLVAGCKSQNTGRAKQRYRTVENSFTDQTARSEYIDRRIRELTDQGVSRDDAAARASREWFARALAVTEVSTAYGLKRRASEADITSYLEKQKEASGR